MELKDTICDYNLDETVNGIKYRLATINDLKEIKKCTDRSCSNDEDTAIHDKYMKMYFKSFEEVSYQQQVDEDWPAGSKLYPYETCREFVGKY